jgi:hypothetical protein
MPPKKYIIKTFRVISGLKLRVIAVREIAGQQHLLTHAMHGFKMGVFFTADCTNFKGLPTYGRTQIKRVLLGV